MHTPPHQKILGDKEFEALGVGKILVNTCIGVTMDEAAFNKWAENSENKAVFDLVSGRAYDDILDRDNIVVHPNSAFDSIEANRNLSEKFVENMEHYLANK